MSKKFATEEQLAMLADMVLEANGQVLAMNAAIQSLLLVHPDPETAIAFVKNELLWWETSGVNKRVPKALLIGFRRAKISLLPTNNDHHRDP